MLYRKIASLIEAHLQSDSNKILLIDGARQVGKTYIVRYVGQKLFENYIEINLVEDALGAGLFANVRTVEDFYLQVSMLAGDRMKEKENTLIFLDEIQALSPPAHHAQVSGSGRPVHLYRKRLAAGRHAGADPLHSHGQHPKGPDVPPGF